MSPNLLSVEDAAARLDLSRARIRQLIGGGEIKAEKVGRDWVIEKAELDRIAALGRPKPGPKPGSKPRKSK